MQGTIILYIPFKFRFYLFKALLHLPANFALSVVWKFHCSSTTEFNAAIKARKPTRYMGLALECLVVPSSPIAPEIAIVRVLFCCSLRGIGTVCTWAYPSGCLFVHVHYNGARSSHPRTSASGRAHPRWQKRDNLR